MNEHGRLMDKDHFDSVFGLAQNKLRTEMRDDIAVRVLIAMIEATPTEVSQNATADTVPEMARTAYRFADAMLAAREGKKETPEEVVKALQAPLIQPTEPRPAFKPGDRVRMRGIPAHGKGTVRKDQCPPVGLVTVLWDVGHITWELCSKLELAE